MSEHIQLKKELYQLACESIAFKIEENKKALADLKESVGSESKSTAGDKHETGRAMIHLEQEKVGRQMQNNLKLKKAIDSLRPENKSHKVGLGALVICDKIRFYVMASLGQHTLYGNKYYFVSMKSEIVQAFLGKEQGAHIEFKGQIYTLKDIV
ncbi:hypothetical protein [Labilibaculum sp.]|uniref:hypothetical protein n=1 Tax=Labilibaculum sp. TaxID=2060723 RepID=UPI0035663D1C